MTGFFSHVVNRHGNSGTVTSHESWSEVEVASWAVAVAVVTLLSRSASGPCRRHWQLEYLPCSGQRHRTVTAVMYQPGRPAAFMTVTSVPTSVTRIAKSRLTRQRSEGKHQNWLFERLNQIDRRQSFKHRLKENSCTCY